MTNEVQTYLKFANLQMAAEASLDRFPITTTQGFKDALVFGNNRSSKFTDLQAAQFASEGTIGVRLQLNHFSKDCENAVSGTFTDKIFSSPIHTGASSS